MATTNEYLGYCLGCRVPDQLAPAIEFSRIQTEAATNILEPPKSPDKIGIPLEIDHLKQFKQWDMLGNDIFEDCIAVTWSNTRRVVTANLTSREVYPDRSQVLTYFGTQNPGFDPTNKALKYVSNHPMYIQPGLTYLVNNGGPDGTRALAFARVDPPNFENLRTAIAIFGSVWLGVRVYNHNRQQTHKKEAWTLSTNADETKKQGNGHSVLAGAYSQDGHLKFVTWATVGELSSEYIAGYPAGDDQVKPPIFEAYVVVWPEHIGTRRFMAGINLHQLAEEYSRITGKSLELPAAKFNSLYFCPATENQDTFLKVQKVDADQSYASITMESTTPIQQSDAYMGTLVMESGDLYFIKTQDTKSKAVEVSRARGPDFGRFDLYQTATAFKIEESEDGFWTVDNGDVYFIKTGRTSSGKIEVHYAMRQDNFQTIKQYVSGIAFGEIGYGAYTVVGGDLYLILDGYSESGCVEVFCAKGTEQYRSVERFVTGFKLNEVSGYGSWDIGTNSDLYLIKTYGTASGMVEIYIASSKSRYTDIKSYSTAFKADNKTGGYYKNAFIPENTVGEWMI